MGLMDQPLAEMDDDALTKAWAWAVKLRPNNSTGMFKNRMKEIHAEMTRRGLPTEDDPW